MKANDPRGSASSGFSAYVVLGIAALALLGVGAGLYVSRISPKIEPQDVQEPIPRAVGAERYDALLAKAAGLPLSGVALVRRAAERCETWQEQMQVVAEMIESGADWRALFETLRQDHPADADQVLAAYRQEIERAREAVAELELVRLPQEGVTVAEIRNPIFQRYFSLAMYLDGRLAVTARPAEAGQASAPGYLRNHCRVCIPPLAVHEVYPGHHVAFERAAEHLTDAKKRVATNRRQVMYHEGWGLYAEYLMLEQGYYQEPERKLGVLRMLYLRGLRAWIDPQLHSGEMSRQEAERHYREDALMTPDAARSEVERHLKDPTMKASYFIGLEQILTLRSQWSSEHVGAPLSAFHERFLGVPKPIPVVARERFGLTLERPL